MSQLEFSFDPIEVGKVYELDGEILQCTKVGKVCSFKVVDKDGNRVKTYYPNGLIADHGTRLIMNRLNELKILTPQH